MPIARTWKPASLTFHTLGHVDFLDATPNELEQLTQACEPATFGFNKET